MKTFIVRIYRYDPDNPRLLVGDIEDSRTETREAFKTADDLLKILLMFADAIGEDKRATKDTGKRPNKGTRKQRTG